jgi:type VI secretion system protein ImpE
MKAEALLREGKLDDSIEALGTHLREHPEDTRSRTFLFELLCFRGDLDRARKNLSLLGSETKESAAAILLYEGALQAEETRRKVLDDETYLPDTTAPSKVAGEINGRRFESLADSDPRIGARLEVFAAGDYLWIPFRHIASLRMEPPKRLRDLLWAPGFLRTGPEFDSRELGEVLLPALAPSTYIHPDSVVRLGRVSEWCADEDGRELPYGQKMLLVDGEEFPFLELRSMTIEQSREVAS